MKYLTPTLIILLVAAATWLIVHLRVEQVAEPGEITEEELHPVRRKYSFAFGVAALLFGLVAALAYAFTAGRWPAAAQPLFFWLGLGLAVFFSIGAAIVRPEAGMRGVPEVIVMNFLWGLGFGWLLPLVLR